VIIERIALPGTGTCHTGTTARRQRIGVICHRSGRRDLVLYDPDDPDRATHTVVLDSAEARHVADLLAATITIDHVSDLERKIAGTSVARIRIPAGSPYDGHPLCDTSARYAVSVVAVIRDEQTITAPDADFILQHGDTVVMAGESADITALTGHLLGSRSGPLPPDAPLRRRGRRPVADLRGSRRP
jgi:TrkA domain protein